MSLDCPQCGAEAPAGTLPGRVYACRACGNPVLPHEKPVVAALAVDEYVAPPARSPWPLIALAMVVLLAAHAGFWALLTAETRRDRDALRALHGDAVLTAPEPGAAPSVDDGAAMAKHIAADRLYRARQRYESLSSQVNQLAAGLSVSFAAQAVLLGLLGVRWLRSRQRSAPPSRAPASRASRAP